MPCDWCVESPAIGRPSGPADFAALSPEMEALKVTPGAVPSEFGFKRWVQSPAGVGRESVHGKVWIHKFPQNFIFHFYCFEPDLARTGNNALVGKECGSDEERVESVCSMRLADHMFLRVCSMHL